MRSLDDRGDFGCRSIEVRASSLNIDDRSIMADIATENPVLMPDYERMEMVPEVLLASGAQIPKSRQVPFLDSHQRSSVASQLGSARDIAIDQGKLTARLVFSESAADEFTKVREGHVTDVSAGYEVLKRQYVAAGQTKTISGREFSGPCNVATKWRLREVSLTPIGADEQAKMRGLDLASFRGSAQSQGAFKMDEALRALCVERGMSNDCDDAAAQKWIVANADKLSGRGDDPKYRLATGDEMVKKAIQDAVDKAAKSARQEVLDALKAEEERSAKFRAEVDAVCKLAGCQEEAEACRSMKSIEEVRKHLEAAQAKKAEQLPTFPSIRQIGSGFDNFVRDAGAALTLRSLQSSGAKTDAIERILPTAKRPQGAATFARASVYQIAEEFVRACGVDTRGMTRDDVAILAMFGVEKGSQITGQRSAMPAYHTTASFSNLTLDAVNKAMMIGYTEAPSTWLGPMRQAASVADFKNIHRVRMGAIPNLPVWPDNSNPERASFSDVKETYAVESRSLQIDFSYRLLVNDDMDAISRVPFMLGAAAARTVNAVAWSQLTSNPTMSDGVALFSAASGNRKRSNLTTGAGAPSVTTVGTLTNLMRQMRGENTPDNNEGADILNLQPRYIVGPSALETVINQLVTSAYDPSANVNTMVSNPTRVLTPVIEPLLDAASTTAWYLFADTSQIDTIEVSFLQGQETPVVRNFLDDRNLSQTFVVLQTFAAKAMNHRGIQQHAGA